MLSENTNTSRFRELSAYAQLGEPRTLRLGFTKTGALQYISHLDLQRTFIRILSRAELPLWYTQGFNPHPKLVFALPLSVGSESVCELADIRIERDMPEDEVLKRLRASSTAELDFFACYRPETKFSEIASAEYEIAIDTLPGCTHEVANLTQALLKEPMYVIKRTKSGERETDIVPFIRECRISVDDNCKVTLLTVLAAGSDGSLSPEYLVSALRERIPELPVQGEHKVMRRRMLDAAGNTFR